MRCPLHPTPRRVLTCSSPLHSPLYCLTLAHHLPLFTHSLLSHALSPSHCPQHHRPLHRHTASLTLPLSCILPMLSSISMAHTLNYYYSLHSIYLTLSLSLCVCVCVCVCGSLAVFFYVYVIVTMTCIKQASTTTNNRAHSALRHTHSASHFTLQLHPFTWLLHPRGLHFLSSLWKS